MEYFLFGKKFRVSLAFINSMDTNCYNEINKQLAKIEEELEKLKADKDALVNAAKESAESCCNDLHCESGSIMGEALKAIGEIE